VNSRRPIFQIGRAGVQHFPQPIEKIGLQENGHSISLVGVAV